MIVQRLRALGGFERLFLALSAIVGAKGLYDFGARMIYELVVPYMGDNSYFLTVGRGIINGLVPYADLFESKPPAVFLLLAASLGVSGGLLFARVLQVATLILLATLPAAATIRAARKTEGPAKRAILASGLLFSLTIGLYASLSSG